MALIPVSKQYQHSLKAMVYTWNGVGVGDTCEPVKVWQFDDNTLYAHGTFFGDEDIGADLSPEAAVNAPTLTGIKAESSGTTIALNANGCKNIDQGTVWITPTNAAGDGTTDIDIWLVCK